MTDQDPEPKGIGGWLILAAICLVGAILIFLSILWVFYSFIGLSQHPSEIYGLLPPILITTLFLLITVIVTIRFFEKKKSAIKGLILLQVVGIICLVIPSFVGVDNIKFPEIMGNIPFHILWIFYFLKSKRVKNTFINP